MARYVVPSVAISALYSAYKYIYPANNDRPLTIHQAVSNLNRNVETQEAIRVIQQYRHDFTFLSEMSPAALAQLAQRGSDLCHFVAVNRCDPLFRENFELILNKFDLGADWHSALESLNRVACPEEDLACPEEWFTRRPSQIERLHQLLQLLFLKTEKTFDVSKINSEVVAFLYNLYVEFRESNKEMGILALKTLSNIACRDIKYANEIFSSEWLPLLSDLVDHGETLDERLLSHKICQNSLYTFGIIDYQLSPDVYELYLSDKKPLVDIILIHGLRGSVGYTWRQNDGSKKMATECWPKDWLPLDISTPMRIIGLDYPSYLIHFTGTMESLQVRADRFKNQLKEAGVGKRPVVFICHSMGGLLAKRLLLDLPELAERTAGVLFIATPHRGSPIASWGYSILRPTDDVRILHEKNEINRQLNEDFSKIAAKIPVIVSMVETKESNLIGTAKGIIVPTQSAVFEKGAVYHIEDVHHNVCKPSERTSACYGVVINFLRDCIYEAKKKLKM